MSSASENIDFRFEYFLPQSTRASRSSSRRASFVSFKMQLSECSPAVCWRRKRKRRSAYLREASYRTSQQVSSDLPQRGTQKPDVKGEDSSSPRMDATGFKTNYGSTSKAEDEMASVVDMAMLRFHRLNQMTEGDDDPEIATRLLHEKEKDLELAARIGKALLQRNDDLQRKNEILEEQMGYASDQVTQLKHELQRKSELLRVFTEESGDASGDSKRSPERATCGHLQRRVRLLEEENAVLKVDITQLKAMTIVLKEKEDQIVAEFLKKIAEAKRQTKAVCAELQEKQGECDAKVNKIRCLTKEITEKSNNEQKLKEENEILASKLRVLQGLQEELSQELSDLQERYTEVVSMLAGAKQELKEAQETAAEARFSTCSIPDDSLYDSLASELEASDSGYSFNYRNHQLPSAVSAVCCSGRNEAVEAESQPSENEKAEQAYDERVAVEHREHFAVEDHVTAEDAIFDPVEPNIEASERAKGIMRSIEAAMAMPLYSKNLSCKYATRLGVPGTPGSKDLEFAIERLSYRPVQDLNEVQPATKTVQHDGTDNVDDSLQSDISVQPKKTAPSRAKLMLVVPVEGSRALAHWKQLATPSGIDPRSWEKLPGINVKSGFGISNSPRLPFPNKQYAVSSIFVNANLPVPASAHPKIEGQEPSAAATMLSSSCSGRVVPDHQRSRSRYVDSDVTDSSVSKSGQSLTKRCVGFLNSWLASGTQVPIDESQSPTAALSGMTEKLEVDDHDSRGLDSHAEEHGLLGSLCDNANQVHFGSSVVMRTGMKASKQ